MIHCESVFLPSAKGQAGLFLPSQHVAKHAMEAGLSPFFGY